MKLSDAAQRYMDRNPTKIGVVAGIPFYEDIAFGDEKPLLYISREGKLGRSPWYELPEFDEVVEWGIALDHHAK